MSRCQSTANHSMQAVRDGRPDALDRGQLLAPVVAAASIASIEPNCRASACAAVGPTCRIDSATSTRHSGRVLASARLSSSFAALLPRLPSLLTKNGDSRSSSASRSNSSPSSVMHAGVEQRLRRPCSPAPRCRTRRGRPGGTRARAAAPGRTGCSGSGCRRRPPWPAPARCRTPGSASASRTRARPSGRRSTTGPSTSGMTSPALRSTTVSPISTPLRSTSRALCRVASATVEPADPDRLQHRERRHPAGAARR